jgi:hypothetical protein
MCAVAPGCMQDLHWAGLPPALIDVLKQEAGESESSAGRLLSYWAAAALGPCGG